MVICVMLCPEGKVPQLPGPRAGSSQGPLNLWIVKPCPQLKGPLTLWIRIGYITPAFWFWGSPVWGKSKWVPMDCQAPLVPMDSKGSTFGN